MKNFEELDKRKISEVEESIRAKWEEMDILSRTIQNREGKTDFVFYDGPIYANARPGIHHVLAKAIKDSFCKYKTMQGYRVLRKIGLDTHGLPIEVNVEKKLGFQSKADIEAFGVENFCRECNKATALNIDEINSLTDTMGQFIDCKNPYVTCSNEYIESEWWIIKEMDKKGLLYHGNKVLWYCPRCGTELSANEVSQGYEQDSVNTVIVPFKKIDEDVYLLAWTTTPWTLLANVALCVNPDLTYIKVESQGYTFILAEVLAQKVLGEEYNVLETYHGKDLVGIKYEQLMPFVNIEGKCHEVIADNYVTAVDGTGIVHIAPYGADDNRVCMENGISLVNPVGLDGCYTEGPWKGTLVTDKELEVEIIKWLKENDKLFKKIKITHDYPHCWRCHAPLISYPKEAWYVKTTEYKDKIIEANQKVNWYPEYVGTKRFNNWLENMVDWGISRNRYWGCPLPIWICEDCGHKHVVGSREELQSLILEDVDVEKLELHRPYVDALHIKCSECGHTMQRVRDVLDVWFDSGAMPYAQFHYPFENKELFESQFPADFIAEGVDQTRGWFYVLLVISTIISGESSFKNVVVNDMVLDQYGKKMSKSVGNVVDPKEALTEYGADNIRWYMFYVSPVWTPLKYDDAGVKEVYSKFFNPLKNTYTFFQTYANIDQISIEECFVPYENREEIDKWLLSKYHKLVRDCTEAYDMYDLNQVVKMVTNFVSEDLSNWYIRRNRNRFWASNTDTSKKAVYITTYEVLTGLCKLCAPIVPYVTEEIYTKLTKEESIHLADFPQYDASLIHEHIEERMDLVRNLISIGRYIREETKIKVRQPLKEALLDGKNEELISDLVPLIEEELNIKKVTFVQNLNEYMNLSVKPNFKVVGKLFGSFIKEFSAKLESLSVEEITKLQNDESLFLTINEKEYEITSAMVDIRISSKEGFNVGMENNHFIILDTTLTEELLEEGVARELVSKIQNMRKNLDFEIMDRIDVCYLGDDFVNQAVEHFKEFIKSEVLASSLIQEKGTESLDLNGHEVFVSIKRV